jgi:thimet oligopeptidase
MPPSPACRSSTAFSTDLFQSEKLYARVKAIEPANAHEAKLSKNLIEGYEDSGVALPSDKRARAKEITSRLEVLRQTFERAVRDDPTTVRFTTEELAGVPESFFKARKAEADGSWVLKPDEPTYDAVMTNAKARTRASACTWRSSSAAAPATCVLEEAYRLRQELAALYGLPSYAHYVQRRRMVGSPRRGERSSPR